MLEIIHEFGVRIVACNNGRSAIQGTHQAWKSGSGTEFKNGFALDKRFPIFF